MRELSDKDDTLHSIGYERGYAAGYAAAQAAMPPREPTRAMSDHQSAAAINSGAPMIGSAFPDQPGIYAGLIARPDELGGDAHLVVLDGDLDELTWPEALAWAESVGGGLPTRREQAVLFGNVPQLFEKTWYWSSEQYAGYYESAWFQTFNTGYQGYYRKASRCRARAVRRVPL